MVYVTLRGLALANTVSTVVIAEYVTVQPRAQTYKEAGHLPHIYSVSVAKQYGVARFGRAPHIHHGYLVSGTRLSLQNLNTVKLLLAVLELRSVVQVQVIPASCCR